MPNSTGSLLILAGVVLIVLGLVWIAGAGSWLGRLPGDIRIERDGFGLYVPITTCLILSIVLTSVLWLFNRLFR